MITPRMKRPMCGFIKLVKVSVITLVVILVLMAYFLV